MKDSGLAHGAKNGAIRGERGLKESRFLSFQREQLLLAFHRPKFDGLLPIAAGREALAVCWGSRPADVVIADPVLGFGWLSIA